VPSLAAEPFDLRDGHTLYADFRQCVTNVIESKGFDDCRYQLHESP
jgi:hypothetical protein